MIRSWKMLVLAVFASMTAVGCKNALYDDNQRYRAQNTELQAQNVALNQRVVALEDELGRRPDASQVAGLQSTLAEREAKIAELEAKLKAPGIEGIETEYNAAKGEMTVRVPGDVLFDSGAATLKASAKATLDKIASALATDYAGKAVRVEGHTDNEPLQKTKAQWGDNRMLSSARAIAVTRYLESKGVDPKRIASIGYGEYHPRGNDKSKNRRVEIVVVVR